MTFHIHAPCSLEIRERAVRASDDLGIDEAARGFSVGTATIGISRALRRVRYRLRRKVILAREREGPHVVEARLRYIASVSSTGGVSS